MTLVRRSGLLAVLLLAALAARAGAFVETASYEVPGGGIADCLRAAGPSRLALLGAFGRAGTSIALLGAGPGAASLAPAAGAAFGRLASCPQVAAAGGEPPLLAALTLDARRRRVAALQVAAPGSAPVTLATGPGLQSVSLATAPGGAAVVAWIDDVGSAPARLVAAIRPPGQARFGTPATVDDDASVDVRPATGIDASGRATVAWIDEAPLQHARPGVVRVADAAADGRFAPPRDLTRAWDGRVALAVTPQGRVLLATDGLDALRAYERPPGGSRFARVHLPPAGSTEDLAVAMNPDGGAVVAYRNDERSVFALVRTAGGAFRDGGTVVLHEDGSQGAGSSFFAILFDRRGPQPPYDGAGGDLSVALTPAGEALLTWVDDARSADAAAADAAQGTLADGFGRPRRLGSPCDSAAAARPLALADGTLGVAWADDARARAVAGTTLPQGGGRVHVALGRLAAGAPAAQPPLPAPGLSARLAGPRALGTGEPLLVHVACRARCDVRAGATARTVAQPHWLNGGDRGGEPFELGASTGLPAGGSATLRLAPVSGVNAAGAHGAPRTPIAVIACAPGGPVAERIELAPPRVRAPRPIPRMLDVLARRVGAGGAVRVTWRTSIPARRARFLLYGLAGGSRPAAHARRSGRGRTRFAVTLRPRPGRRMRSVVLLLETPEVLAAAFATRRVR